MSEWFEALAVVLIVVALVAGAVWSSRTPENSPKPRGHDGGFGGGG